MAGTITAAAVGCRERGESGAAWFTEGGPGGVPGGPPESQDMAQDG